MTHLKNETCENLYLLWYLSKKTPSKRTKRQEFGYFCNFRKVGPSKRTKRALNFSVLFRRIPQYNYFFKQIFLFSFFLLRTFSNLINSFSSSFSLKNEYSKPKSQKIFLCLILIKIRKKQV